MGAACTFQDEEVLSFIRLVKETNSFKHLDGRVQRNVEVFKRLAAMVNEKEKADKTPEQWRTKW
jgi:hypothetical protein